MDIRETRSQQNQDVQKNIRKDLPNKAKLQPNPLQTHATRSRAPELIDLMKQNEPFEEVRPELVQQAKQRLRSGEYMERSTALKTASAILLSS